MGQRDMDTRVTVGSDVGIVAMRTFIEMTADSKKSKPKKSWLYER